LEIPEETVQYAGEAGLSFEQMFGEGNIPTAELAWKYVHGEPLVRTERMPCLQTQMQNLHEWYIEFAEQGRKMIMVSVRKEHFLYDNELELEEIFQLYNQNDLDKALIKCYCL
jgi:hypothetical protein